MRRWDGLALGKKHKQGEGPVRDHSWDQIGYTRRFALLDSLEIFPLFVS